MPSHVVFKKNKSRTESVVIEFCHLLSSLKADYICFRISSYLMDLFIKSRHLWGSSVNWKFPRILDIDFLCYGGIVFLKAMMNIQIADGPLIYLCWQLEKKNATLKHSAKQKNSNYLEGAYYSISTSYSDCFNWFLRSV